MANTPEKKRLKKLPMSVALGVASLTLHKHLLKEGAPKADEKGTYDVEEVKAWMAAQSSANVEGSVLGELRARKLRQEVEEMETRNRIRRRSLIEESEIAPAIAAFNAELVTNLKQKFSIELPQKYRGKGTVECQQLNDAAIDFIIDRLKAGQWALGLKREAE